MLRRETVPDANTVYDWISEVALRLHELEPEHKLLVETHVLYDEHASIESVSAFLDRYDPDEREFEQAMVEYLNELENAVEDIERSGSGRVDEMSAAEEVYAQ